MTPWWMLRFSPEGARRPLRHGAKARRATSPFAKGEQGGEGDPLPALPLLHHEADDLGGGFEMFARDGLVDVDGRVEGAG